MAYKIAICDDSRTDAQFVLSKLEVWAKTRKMSIFTEYFSSAENFLFQYAEDKTYDILLLDIEMDKIDGVTMARQIRQENDTIQIVFITGYSDYISEGYEVAALHYLMKPVDEQKLFSVLDRAMEKLIKNEKSLTLAMSGETVRIPLRKIQYIDVRQNYVTVHANEDYTIKCSLSEFEKMLDDRFFRAGRAIIVNLTYIIKVTKTDVYLSDGSILPLPRGAYEAINRAIISNT